MKAEDGNFPLLIFNLYIQHRRLSSGDYALSYDEGEIFRIDKGGCYFSGKRVRY